MSRDIVAFALAFGLSYVISKAIYKALNVRTPFQILMGYANA